MVAEGAVMEERADTALMQRMAEERAVCRVLNVWAYSRDSGDWEALRNCFHPDGTIKVSWFSGSAADFVERSKAMTAERRPQERSKHLLGNMRADVNGSRAVLEADAAITVREFIDGHLFDFVSHARFFHLVEKRNGEWRILQANCIYEKDRLDPVIPGSVPASFYDQVDLLGPGDGFAFMHFRQTKKGRTVPSGLPLAGSSEERALREAARRWLAEA
jgi:SnoaL-like domain